MFRETSLAVAAVLLMTGAANADPIEGSYRTPKTGSTARVAACGGSFCMTYTSGEFNGRQFAKFQADGDGNYSGTLTDYSDGAKHRQGQARR